MTTKPNPLPVYSVQTTGSEFILYRDETPLQTPRTLAVTLPTKALAEAIRVECDGQGEKLDLRQMPLTQMALTAIDITSHHRKEVVDGIMRFGENELICQRAAEPVDLVDKQNEVWGPYLDWCQKTFHISLYTGSGIIPFKQKTEALDVLRAYVEHFDAFRLTGVSEAVGISGSLILGLALIRGHASASLVMETAELDHIWQAQKWGEDPVTIARQKAIKEELEVCSRWLALLDGQPLP